MQLNKEEFKTLVMLYASNIDGNIHPEEMEVMLERTDEPTFKKISKVYKKMSDSEILACIHSNKGLFENPEQLMDSIRAVVKADEKRTPMENYLLKSVEKILKGC